MSFLYLSQPEVKTPGQGVDLLLRSEQEIEKIEEQLSAAKAYHRELATVVLPEVFASADTTEATSTSGAKAKMGMHVEGSLPKVDEKAPEDQQLLQEQAREAAIRLADSYGWGPLIKTKMTAAWDKGDRMKALETFAQLRRQDNSVILKLDESIHPQTLAAQVKRRIKEGKGCDTSTLGVTVLTAVKLTVRPKQQ